MSYKSWGDTMPLEEVHSLDKTVFVYASPLCFLQDALVRNWQGALIFITCRAVMGMWEGSGGEVPERAADVSEGMEITSNNSNNCSEISRRSLIFIEHNTSHTKHTTLTGVVKLKKKPNHKFTWGTWTQAVGADPYWGYRSLCFYSEICSCSEGQEH